MTDRSALGRSGLSVSPFCLGLLLPSVPPRTVVEAYDMGINFFFLSADMHWPLYETTRRGLAALLTRPGVRDEVVIAVASYLGRAGQLTLPFREVLEAIPGLDRIDVCVAGSCYANDLPERLPTLARHRDTGTFGARALGATFHDRAIIPGVVRAGVLDIALARYNPSHPGARVDVLPHLGPSSTLLYTFKSGYGWVSEEALRGVGGLPEGLWLPRPEDHYRFALSRARIDGILCAPQGVDELHALGRALERGPLDEEEEEHMIDLALLVSGRASMRPSLGGEGHR
jgi:hypothetical protein